LLQYIWLIPLGLLIGTLGTLIGAGGGFVLLPVLLLLYPGADPETVTSISLAVVFFNALSGSWAYARMRRIDYTSGWRYAGDVMIRQVRAQNGIFITEGGGDVSGS